MTKQFSKDIDQGLSSSPKTLPSKYFYNKTGDKLFQDIMALPEYYLTRSELEIFTNKSKEIVNGLSLEHSLQYQLLELGAGDGTKTIKLLEYLNNNNFDFIYSPLDISANALSGLEKKLNTVLPDIQVNTIQGDYFESIKKVGSSEIKKVILFLGSNMGNMTDNEAKGFMELLSNAMNNGDQLILGLDLKKSKEIVLPAYNDSSGVTKQFNLNLLQRMNDELGANFKLEKWEHAPEYNENTGEAKSFIKSVYAQDVYIESTGKTYSFNKNELIQTEISRKYDDIILANILEGTELRIKEKIFDEKVYFCNYIIEK